jgi:hypothetical protein
MKKTNRKITFAPRIQKKPTQQSGIFGKIASEIRKCGKIPRERFMFAPTPIQWRNATATIYIHVHINQVNYTNLKLIIIIKIYSLRPKV